MSRQIETVTTLGPAASFSHEVTERIKNSDPLYGKAEILFGKTIADVCQSLVDGKTQQAVVPLENSTDGPVRDTLDAFKLHPLRIRGEVIHPISLSAYHRQGVNPEDIKYVASKDSALGQVRRNAAKLFPNAKPVERPSTVAAILEAADNPEMAAIGPRMAGIVYNLRDKMVQIDDVHDDPLNATRFKIIDPPDEEEVPATGNDKTSLIVQIPDRPGSLYRVVDVLANEGISLTKIKSFGQESGHVAFWMDCLGHQEDSHLLSALRRLLRQGVGIKIFGSYPIDNYLQPEILWELNMEYSIEKLKREVINGINHRDKTVIAFTLVDRIGALRDALGPFNSREINLTAIDSLPTGRLGEYIFYLALENGVNQGIQAIEELKAYCTRLVLI